MTESPQKQIKTTNEVDVPITQQIIQTCETTGSQRKKGTRSEKDISGAKSVSPETPREQNPLNANLRKSAGTKPTTTEKSNDYKNIDYSQQTENPKSMA